MLQSNLIKKNHNYNMFIRKENDYLSKKALNMNLKFSPFFPYDLWSLLMFGWAM